MRGNVNQSKTRKESFWRGVTRELAHQMGTPLSALLGWVDVLPSLKNPAVAYQEIHRDVDRLCLISERLGSVAEPSKFEFLPLNELLEATEAFLRKRLPTSASGVQIIVAVNPKLRVYGNRILLQWALECLAKNALDALESSTGQILLSGRSGRSCVFIELTDSGRGIPQEILKRIFQPGFSTKPGGQGVGLALVKHIVETGHGGKASIVSRGSGQGACVALKFKTRQL